MKIRHSTSTGEDKIELQMTPMIDIVFQLLVFFIMTFKIVAQEGDFNIKMPLAAMAAANPDPNLAPPIKLYLTSDAVGQLQYPFVANNDSLDTFPALTQYVADYIGDARGPDSVQESIEVELHCDYNLRYEYVVQAIDAVSGKRHRDGSITRLVEKIKFAPQAAGPGE
jgi:biopolymer transport protein ExbD